jgi:hypothetical protein
MDTFTSSSSWYPSPSNVFLCIPLQASHSIHTNVGSESLATASGGLALAERGPKGIQQ